MTEEFEASKWLSIFGVVAEDPAYIYVIHSASRLKIGRTRNRKTRLKEAKTWSPDGTVLAIKPFWNHTFLEKHLQVGLTMAWYEGEWYDFEGDTFEGWFVEEFQSFDDHDINRNSVDFIYLMNSTGMTEFTLEFSMNNVSKSKFQRKESWHSRHRNPGKT